MSDELARPETGDEGFVYDIDVIRRVEGVTPPKQARSSAMLQRILKAMDELIREKPFDEITIPEVAARARCGMAGIYARFKDKASILAALHETLRSNVLSEEEICPPEHWDERSIDDNLRAIVSRLIGYYSSNRNLLSAVLLMKDEGCYQRAAMNFAQISKVLVERLQERIPDGGQVVDPTAVDVAMRAIFALLQQRLIFHPVSIGYKPALTDEELCEQLVSLLKACIYYR